jgi:DNA-binding NarL/FixJ family response regulator
MNCQARALKPDVVLMDIRILVVTTFDEDEHVFKALRGGASGFVLKDTRPERLLDAIAIVAAGKPCSPRPSPVG